MQFILLVILYILQNVWYKNQNLHCLSINEFIFI
jgi:hypothetical protein